MKNKKIEDMSIEELLEELRNSQGPGDALMEITPNGTRVTIGKKDKK
jgi:hypothetical protein